MQMRSNIPVGNGIWDQLKPPIYEPFTVETLYELFPQCDWPILDELLVDRVDLHERIKKFKQKWNRY